MSRFRPRTDGPDWRSTLTYHRFREITEGCGCRWLKEGEEWEGVVYCVDRTDPDLGNLFSIIFLPNIGRLDRIPVNVIRQVCQALNLPPDIFEVQH